MQQVSRETENMTIKNLNLLMKLKRYGCLIITLLTVIILTSSCTDSDQKDMTREMKEAHEELLKHMEVFEQEISIRQTNREIITYITKTAEKRIEIENKIIDLACKIAGYKGLAKNSTSYDLLYLLYQTQQKGGLENYVNFVVQNEDTQDSDHFCNELYKKTKISQILRNTVVYSCFYYENGESFKCLFLVKKETGKIYQEGQLLEDGFYVFDGMQPCSRAFFGAETSLPSFTKITLNLPKDL